MVRGVLYRKLARDILGSWGQSLAVAAVVLSGAALYVAMASSYRNLLLTRDAYYAQYRFADFFVSLERAPKSVRYRLEALPGVRQVRGRIVQDVSLDISGEDEPRTGRIVSMPDHREPVLNDIALLSGRYFEAGARNEVIVSDAFARENGLRARGRIRGLAGHAQAHASGGGDGAVAGVRVHDSGRVGTHTRPGGLRDPVGAGDVCGTGPRTWPGPATTSWALADDPAPTSRPSSSAAEGICSSPTASSFRRWDAKDQISNNFRARRRSKGLGVSARILPSVFFGVAAAVLLVLLSRMVRQERMQIGLLKAYGYTNAAVAGHYIRFALLLSTAGTAAGVLAGLVLARWMVQLYQQFFEFPLLRSRAHPDVIFNAFVLGALFAVAGAVSAARRAARIPPAEALQPEAPRTGTRTGLERWPALWSRLSFTGKMIARNVSRYKLRAAFTVVGVMLSASMVLIGQFSTDAMDYLIAFQFSVTQREDIRVGLESERGKGALYDFARLEHVRRAEPLLAYPFRIGHGWREKDIAVTGLLPDAELFRLVDTEGRRVAVDGPGLIVDDKLADDLGLEAGDTVTLEPLLGRVKGIRRARVARIVPQYLGTGAYMDLHALSRLLDEPFAMNAALLRTERGQARAVARDLKDVAAIASVTRQGRRLRQPHGDPRRHHAGQQRHHRPLREHHRLRYHLQLDLRLADGAAPGAGLACGCWASRRGSRAHPVPGEHPAVRRWGSRWAFRSGLSCAGLLVEAYETDLYRFPFRVSPGAFVYTVVFTSLFVLVANAAVHRQVKRLDLVEVLKARE
jgi:putative ABC transport system permease protein